MKHSIICILVLLMCLTLLSEGSRPEPQKSSNGDTQKSSSTSNDKRRVKVIIDHDGGVEDLISMMLLLTQPQVDLLLVSYVEADSIKEVAINTSLKLSHRLNRTDVPLAVSTLKPKNPFPLLYRSGPLAADVLPSLNPPGLDMKALREKMLVKEPGQDYLTKVLSEAKEPVVVVATGPLTNIAYALRKNPAVADKISQLWWMGGTLRHPGNIFNESNSDGSGEWNVFSDPDAAGVVWDSKVPVTLVPLDATNKVPITPELLYRIGSKAQQCGLSQLVGEMYAPTVTWVYLRPFDPYYAWDTLNTACMLDPSICKFEKSNVQVVLSGPAQGATRIVGQQSNSTGSSSSTSGSSSSSSSSSKAGVLSKVKGVTAAVDADSKKFDTFMLNAFR